MRTKQVPWSVKIKKRRLSFFGHICRLPDDTPVKIALQEAKRPVKKPRGRPNTTYLKQVEKELKNYNITSYYDAINIPQDRNLWKTRTQD